MTALKVDNLRKTFSGGVEALKGIQFEVQENDFFALLGPNGAGKSTTISIITSLIKPTAGTVSVFGHDLARERDTVKSLIGVVPQEFNFNIFETPLSIVVNQAGYYGVPRREAFKRGEELLKRFDLWEKRDTQSRMLSGGMKRRLMIARALMHKPKLLILDEPTASVDIEIRRDMWDFLQDINREKTTIILTTHYLDEAEKLCRHVAIIDKGEIKANTTMRELLGMLEVERIHLTVKEPLSAAPTLINYPTQLIDDTLLAVDIDKKFGMGDAFKQLESLGIFVLHMQQKTSRLETLFLNLVDTQNE